MTFQEVLETRYSVREYSSKKVEEEKIQQILEAVRLAPTAKNSQPQKIYVASSDESLTKIDAITTCRFGAPLAFVICGDKDRACILKSNGRNFLETDVTIIQTYMMLKAAELGLGSCWIGRFTPENAQQILSLKENILPYGILIVGYPAETSKPASFHIDRLELSDFVETI